MFLLLGGDVEQGVRVARIEGTEHRFGGAWTALKLDAVGHYLNFYTDVLKTQPFDLWYIDAFAGSGTSAFQATTGGLFDGTPTEEATVTLTGSVLRALSTEHPFQKLIFIEGDAGRFVALDKIREANPDRDITTLHGDANEQLSSIFTSDPWSGQQNGRGNLRALVFLDPYGMTVTWETLKLLANTKAADVWYLFPVSAVTRQLAGDLGRVDEKKQVSLDSIFGTTDWRQKLYEPRPQGNLFDANTEKSERVATKEQIEHFAQSRLRSLFRYVSEPLPLLTAGNAHLFSLYCLSNSSSDKAIGLIQRGVTSVFKNAGAASHRKSVR